MTDTPITWAGLKEVAENAGITPGQARTILEAVGVKMHPAPGWYLTEGGQVARLKHNKHTGAPILNIDGDVLLSNQPWPKLTPAHIVPEGEPITRRDVRKGDLVRVELENGDEVTFTVTWVAPDALASKWNAFLNRSIRTIHLLHREEA